MKFSDLIRFRDMPIIETERLLLRRLVVEDLDDVYSYSKDPSVSEHLLWNPHQSRAFTLKYLKNINRAYKKSEFYDWGIELLENGKIIGTCGFTTFDIPNNNAEIGYVLSREYWGRGIATEAARSVLSFGFDTLNLHRIEARFMSENFASKRVAEKCGMSFEGKYSGSILKNGKYRDVEVYAILQEQYKNRFSVI